MTSRTLLDNEIHEHKKDDFGNLQISVFILGGENLPPNNQFWLNRINSCLYLCVMHKIIICFRAY